MRSRTLPERRPDRKENRLIKMRSSFFARINALRTSIRCLQIPCIRENGCPNHGRNKKVIDQNEWYDAPEIFAGTWLRMTESAVTSTNYILPISAHKLHEPTEK